MNYRKFDLTKAIAEIENQYPPDDLISCYKDFLKHRDYIQYYKYNEKVFYSVITLAAELWNSNLRINRLSMVVAINKYVRNCSEKKEMPDYIVSAVISLLKLIIENKPKTRKLTIDMMLTKTVSTMFDFKISESDINTLIENYTKSEAIINFLLKYPYKSKTIRDWVIKNFNNKNLRQNRAELVSWIIDEEPEYVIDHKVLIEDFEYMNYLDIQRIEKYKEEVEAIKAYRRNMKGILPDFTDYSNPFNWPVNEKDEDEKLPRHLLPELKLTNRFYSYPIDMNDDLNAHICVYKFKTNKYYRQHVHVPDFLKLHKSFHSELDTICKKTMIWGIVYSRREENDKLEMIKKYYSEDIYSTFSYIGKRFKNVEFLKWVLSKVK